MKRVYKEDVSISNEPRLSLFICRQFVNFHSESYLLLSQYLSISIYRVAYNIQTYQLNVTLFYCILFFLLSSMVISCFLHLAPTSLPARQKKCMDGHPSIYEHGTPGQLNGYRDRTISAYLSCGIHYKFLVPVNF